MGYRSRGESICVQYVCMYACVHVCVIGDKGCVTFRGAFMVHVYPLMG